MGIAFPWGILMAIQAYKHGIAVNQLPEPYYFFWGSAAMATAGVVAMANQRLGVVMAWGLLIGVLVFNFQTQANSRKAATANANPTATALGKGIK